MSVEEKLFELRNEFLKEYGIDNAVVKIGILPEAMNALVIDLYKKNKYISYRPSEFGEFNLVGIQLVPRRKETF